MRRPLLAVLLAGVLAGCSTGSAAPRSPGREPSAVPDAPDLTILGAASLSAALERVKVAYETVAPGSTVTLATDSSAALRTQIEQGAPADVFLAADTTTPQKLVDGGYAVGDPVVFAGNELTVIVPKGDAGVIATPADLGRPGVKVIAAGDEVPITRYATQLVANLAREAGYPSDFAAAYAANVVSKEDNVRAVVAKVALGEGDAGIVYVTDAQASSDVESVAVPARANVRADYAGVVVKTSTHPVAAAAFLDWLAGPDGQAVLQRDGFLPPAS